MPTSYAAHARLPWRRRMRASLATSTRRLRTLRCRIPLDDARALRTAVRAGFAETGVVSRAFAREGRWYDDVVLAVALR